MNITIDPIILEHGECLEPEVGEELLLFYPGLLSDEERQQFERHRAACDYCREAYQFWRATGVTSGVKAALAKAKHYVHRHQPERALVLYNRAARFVPDLADTADGQAFWDASGWFQLSAATMKARDLMPFIFPSYAPTSYALAAATDEAAFPLFVEYAQGQVKGKISAAGNIIFFELFHLGPAFQAGVFLVGKNLDPPIPMYIWKITPGQKHRLGTIASLFGKFDMQHISNTLRTFRVFAIHRET